MTNSPNTPAPGTTSPPTTPATPDHAYAVARLRALADGGTPYDHRHDVDVRIDLTVVLNELDRLRGEVESGKDSESYVRAELEHVRTARTEDLARLQGRIDHAVAELGPDATGVEVIAAMHRTLGGVR